MRAFVVIVASAACLSSCSVAKYPPANAAPSRSTIAAAQRSGAASVPGAAAHLKLARDQLSIAERLIDDSKNDEAYLMLQRADADARLALSLTRDVTLSREAEFALQRVQELQSTRH
jgi:hypothetical protein